MESDSIDKPERILRRLLDNYECIHTRPLRENETRRTDSASWIRTPDPSTRRVGASKDLESSAEQQCAGVVATRMASRGTERTKDAASGAT
ncbi:hypothetical protein PF011_g1359 [Phytophthora fragariae]|uniref:Uncharacterized protein n=1 Tax=Phytophthora fragariae TaxID=53985 RepID=A0A6A3MHF5_9STRA|nr:hypothetical protein PF003_g37875 [Phytophthora fragariae]KAE9028885.1 hypothetical protein PF011_g1359 [Phytophthora fragariae]